MSEIRVNKVINEAGTGAVDDSRCNPPSGKTLSGAGTIAVLVEELPLVMYWDT